MSHTKVNLFNQILGLIDRNVVDRLVKKHDTDKGNKGINTWTHIVSMLFMQLADMHSVRDISTGLKSATGNLSHLGIDRVPCKSSVSYLNKHRNYEVFRDMYFELLDKYLVNVKQPRLYAKRIKRKVYIMDSSVIPLSLSVFNWAKFRSKKGGVKLHTVLDYDTGLPNYAVIGQAKEHDIKPAKAHHFASGSVVVVDRAYVDFEWLNVLDGSGVKFVTRLKTNASYDTIDTYLEQSQPENILLDSCIKLTGQKTKKSYPKRLRVVKVYDEENDQEITLLTNDFTWKAQTVGDLYKARWDVEVFFKHLKQLFRVKSFVGTSDNAVRIQMWCSMISMLLVKYLKARAEYKWHLSNLIVFLRLNLFVKIDLYEWLNNPVKKPKKKQAIPTLFDTS